MIKKKFFLVKIFLFFFFGIFLFSLSAFAGRTIRQLFEQSHAFYEEGKHRESIELAKQLLKISPRFYPAYNLIGFNRIREEVNVLDAVYYFDKSLEIEPKQPQIYNLISIIYTELGKEKKGFSYLEKGLQHVPGDFQLNYNAGLAALLVKHQPAEALIYFQKAKKVKPGHQRLLYLIGTSYLLSNQKEMTLDAVTRLREEGNEEFALILEDLIRKTEKGEYIDLNRVIELYRYQPERRQIKENKLPEKERKTEIQSGTPKTQIKGRGVIQIKQKFQPSN